MKHERLGEKAMISKTASKPEKVPDETFGMPAQVIAQAPIQVEIIYSVEEKCREIN